jgi:hypothetical protein
MKNSDSSGEKEKISARFWSFRAVATDIGAGLLIYLMIILILFASRMIPADFLYVAF